MHSVLFALLLFENSLLVRGGVNECKPLNLEQLVIMHKLIDRSDLWRRTRFNALWWSCKHSWCSGESGNEGFRCVLGHV